MPTSGEEASREQVLAECLVGATRQLLVTYHGRFSPQEIERASAASLKSYSNARILDFVPLLVERSARELLTTSAQR